MASYFLLLLSTLSHGWCMQMVTRLSNFRIDYGEATDNELRIIDDSFHFVDDGKKKSIENISSTSCSQKSSAS